MGEQEAPIHGDILESILNRMPLVNLVPACQVSKSWNGAVYSSLRAYNKIKPWLILHTQKRTPPYSTTAHAYDPRSCVWLQIHRPSIQYTSTLRSSHSTLLFMLSPTKFSFSFDPLYIKWQHVDPPRIWRTEPVVAMVGKLIIVAGGTCDFEGDPLAVEIYDLETYTWKRGRSMPEAIEDSASASCLTVAVNSNKMYVTEKTTGVTHVFDANANAWDGPYNIRQPCNTDFCFISFIGFAYNRLILIGVTGLSEEGVDSVKLWELNEESLEVSMEIGEMPKQLVEKLKSEEVDMSSMNVSLMGDCVFISDGWSNKEVVLCELGEGKGCRWSNIGNAGLGDEIAVMNRLVFSCSGVGLCDLHRALASQGWKFNVKEK